MNVPPATAATATSAPPASHSAQRREVREIMAGPLFGDRRNPGGLARAPSLHSGTVR